MIPVTLAVARLPSGPPSRVTLLPALWLLVPGAIGLIGVTDIIGNPATAGLQDLVQPVTSIVAIALGVLCGASIYRAVVAGPRHLRRARHYSDSDLGSDTRPSLGTPPSVGTTDVLRDE
jgi:uncharacterized membrane protein YjjB (DUF3815 family)